MKTAKRRFARPRVATAGLLAMGLLLWSCAGESTDDDPTSEDAGAEDDAASDDGADDDAGGADGEGDDGGDASADASSDDFPEVGVTLTAQMIYGPEQFLSVAFQDFAEAVEEESNGEITFDIEYSGALVPIDQLEDGLSSGVIDMAVHIPLFSPELLPVSQLLSDLSFLNEGSPVVGTLQSAGAYMEHGLSDPHWNEMLDAGVQPLTGLIVLAPGYQLLCADEPVTNLDQAAGKRARVAGRVYAEEAEAIGMTPVELTGAEVYEALQRGVIDCVIGNMVDVRDMGLEEVGDHWTIGTEDAFSGWTSTALSINSDVFEDLPLEAQQLIWDKAGEIFVRDSLAYFFTETTDALQGGVEAGIEFHDWEDDVLTALEDHRSTSLDVARDRAAEIPRLEDGDAFVQEFVDLHEVWLDRLNELGYSDEDHPNWIDFAETNTDGEVDVDPFMEVLIDEALSTRRPQ